jgi:hypothetical protein
MLPQELEEESNMFSVRTLDGERISENLKS